MLTRLKNLKDANKRECDWENRSFKSRQATKRNGEISHGNPESPGESDCDVPNVPFFKYKMSPYICYEVRKAKNARNRNHNKDADRSRPFYLSLVKPKAAGDGKIGGAK